MKPTLIIVDDCEGTREELSRGLRNDFEILSVEESGIHAIESVRTRHPQLVLMDIVMPKMSGIEATQQILSSNPTPPKVVILSGIKDENVVLQAFTAGACDYLMKPCEMKRIVAVLKGLARSAA